MEKGKPDGSSYLRVPSELPLLEKTVGGLLEEQAEAFGDHEALVDIYYQKRLTFRQLNEEVRRFLHHLLHFPVCFPHEKPAMGGKIEKNWLIYSP